MGKKKETTERVDLLIIITVLSASEEAKVPEDKHREGKICIIARLISLRQPHDLVQVPPWQWHIGVKLKSLCLKCFDFSAVPFVGSEVFTFMKIIILTGIMAVCDAEFLDKGERR